MDQAKNVMDEMRLEKWMEKQANSSGNIVIAMISSAYIEQAAKTDSGVSHELDLISKHYEEHEILAVSLEREFDVNWKKSDDERLSLLTRRSVHLPDPTEPIVTLIYRVLCIASATTGR